MQRVNKIKGQLPITVDKKLRYTPLKLPSATSFISKPLSEIGLVW